MGANHVPYTGLLRLAETLWMHESVENGAVLELGFLVRPSPGSTMMGMIVSPEAPNCGGWMAMWNDSEAWVKHADGREFNPVEKMDLNQRARDYHTAIKSTFDMIKEHAN